MRFTSGGLPHSARNERRDAMAKVKKILFRWRVHFCAILLCAADLVWLQYTWRLEFEFGRERKKFLCTTQLLAVFCLFCNFHTLGVPSAKCEWSHSRASSLYRAIDSPFLFRTELVFFFIFSFLPRFRESINLCTIFILPVWLLGILQRRICCDCSTFRLSLLFPI